MINWHGSFAKRQFNSIPILRTVTHPGSELAVKPGQRRRGHSMQYDAQSDRDNGYGEQFLSVRHVRFLKNE
jgi:hypothetical protein